MGELASSEMREVDVYDFVAGGFIGCEGRVAGIQDGGVSDIEPGFVDAYNFALGWVGGGGPGG